MLTSQTNGARKKNNLKERNEWMKEKKYAKINSFANYSIGTSISCRLLYAMVHSIPPIIEHNGWRLISFGEIFHCSHTTFGKRM